ncbi:MAG: hypothetical protein ACKOX3_02865, partial [Bacteroidota bacterium]
NPNTFRLGFWFMTARKFSFNSGLSVLIVFLQSKCFPSGTLLVEAHPERIKIDKKEKTIISR